MRRRQLDRDVVILLLTTLIMVSSWVGFEVYRAYVKTYKPSDIEEFLTPVDPTIDKTFLDKLNLRYQ